VLAEVGCWSVENKLKLLTYTFLHKQSTKNLKKNPQSHKTFHHGQLSLPKLSLIPASISLFITPNLPLKTSRCKSPDKNAHSCYLTNWLVKKAPKNYKIFAVLYPQTGPPRSRLPRKTRNGLQCRPPHAVRVQRGRTHRIHSRRYPPLLDVPHH